MLRAGALAAPQLGPQASPTLRGDACGPWGGGSGGGSCGGGSATPSLSTRWPFTLSSSMLGGCWRCLEKL